MKLGFVGNHRRSGKNFALFHRVCREHGHDYEMAGAMDTELYVEHENMPEFYRSVDALLVTSYWEAHPLVVYEALATGVPVCMHQFVGDCYRAGVYGVAYYTYWDIDIIGRALSELEKNLDRMSSLGVKCINENWTWDKVGSRYKQVYERIAGKENPHVTFLIDSDGWAWRFMADEIKKYVYPNLDVFTIAGKSLDELRNVDWSGTDLILDHPWQLVYDTELYRLIPTEKHVLCVNGPAFLNPAHMEAFINLLPRCKALTTVSLNIVDMLRFTGRSVYYATRGVDTSRFKPEE